MITSLLVPATLFLIQRWRPSFQITHLISSAADNFSMLHSSQQAKAAHDTGCTPCDAVQSTIAVSSLGVPCTHKARPWLVSDFPRAPHQHPQCWSSAISVLPASSCPHLPLHPGHLVLHPDQGLTPAPQRGREKPLHQLGWAERPPHTSPTPPQGGGRCIS